MIELLLVLSIVSIFTLVFAPTILVFENQQDSKIIETQLEAMYFDERKSVNHNVTFNRNGNVNHAQKFYHQGKTCVIQLGYGRFRCE